MKSKNARIRVLQMIPDLPGGGAERMLLHLCRNLDPDRFEVSVCTLFPPAGTHIEHELAAARVPVASLGKRLGFDARMMWRIHRLLGVLRPDILHTHRAVLQYAVPTLLLRRQCKAVHTVHNMAPLEVPASARPFHRVAFMSGVAAVGIGSAVAESFAQQYGRPVRAVIGNGVPVSEVRAPAVSREEWRAMEGIAHDRFVFVCVARLQPQKNIPRLMRAFAKAVGRVKTPPLLLVAGEGPRREEAEAVARDLDVLNYVRFLGQRSDIRELLGAADAFALSSDWEGNPLALMEALAAGLPVVSTRVGGVPEIVTHEETGLLVEASDEAGLGEALVRLASSRALVAAMSAAARRRAERVFDVSVMAAAYAGLYEDLVACGRVEPGANPERERAHG